MKDPKSLVLPLHHGVSISCLQLPKAAKGGRFCTFQAVELLSCYESIGKGSPLFAPGAVDLTSCTMQRI